MLVNRGPAWRSGMTAPSDFVIARASSRSYPPSASSLAEERTPPLPPPHHGGRAISRRSQSIPYLSSFLFFYFFSFSFFLFLLFLLLHSSIFLYLLVFLSSLYFLLFFLFSLLISYPLFSLIHLSFFPFFFSFFYPLFPHSLYSDSFQPRCFFDAYAATPLSFQLLPSSLSCAHFCTSLPFRTFAPGADVALHRVPINSVIAWRIAMTVPYSDRADQDERGR